MASSIQTLLIENEFPALNTIRESLVEKDEVISGVAKNAEEALADLGRYMHGDRTLVP